MRMQAYVWQGREGDPLGMVQKIRIWPGWQLYMNKPESIQEN